jgi:hypothetical protein
MAKRAKIDSNLFSKTSEEARRPEPTRSAAYRIGQETIDRINAAAKRHNVQKGDLVKFLLAYALDQLDAGALQLPTEPPTGPQRIRFD